MGWLFTKKSKEQLVATLVQSSSNENVSNEVLDHHLVGSVLWSLVRLTVKKEGLAQIKAGESLVFIRCDLLDQQDGGWGYKAMEESMHPYYYSCPPGFLDQAPEQSAEWRAGVRKFHAPQAPAPAQEQLRASAPLKHNPS